MFCDNFGSSATVNGTGSKVAQTPQTNKADISKPSPKRSPKPIKKGLKRARTPDYKISELSQDSSALDCCDYWLQFDGDDDCLESLGNFDNQTDLLKTGRVGQSGGFNMDTPSKTDDWLGDSALDHALSSEEDSFSMALDDDFTSGDSAQPQDVAPERLYSTPLSWDAPRSGVRNETYFNVNPTFNDLERQRLIAIAMGSGLTQMNKSMDFNFDMHSSPSEMSDTTSNPPDRKRRASFAVTASAKTSRSNSRSGPITPNEPAEPATKKEKPQHNDRAAHNDIERKYRTNLKDRISDLREAIPSLRSIPEDFDDDGSPVPASRAPKINKVSMTGPARTSTQKLIRNSRARFSQRPRNTSTSWSDATGVCQIRTRNFFEDFKLLSNYSERVQHPQLGSLKVTAVPSSTRRCDSHHRG